MTTHCDDNDISFLIYRFRKNPVGLEMLRRERRADGQTDWLTDWLAGWLTGRLTD